MVQPANSDLIILDREGDLVLAVGDHDVRRFLVSSKTLCLASSVFATMLGPNFKEGQELRESWKRGPGSPSTITMREDDPRAMDVILSALHFQTNRVNDTLPVDKLAKIAIHSDKFDLNKALTPWIDIWCNHIESSVRPSDGLRDMGCSILAAYLFRSPKLWAISTRFVKDMPPDFAETWEKADELSAHLPEQVWEHLRRQITHALSRLRSRIILTLDHLRTSSTNGSLAPCLWKDVHVCKEVKTSDGFMFLSRPSDYLYLHAMRKVGIWPTLHVFEVLPVNKAVKLVKEALELANHECSRSGTSDPRARCPLLTELDRLSAAVDRIQRNMVGVSRFT